MASAQDQQNFLTQYSGYAQYAGQQLGVNPNYILGQWALETGYGTKFAGSNNLGNIQGNNKTPYSYSSVQAGVDAYVQTLKNPRYSSALSANSPLGFGYALQNAGYATDTNYGYKVGNTISSIQKGSMSFFDKMNSMISGGTMGGGSTGLEPDKTYTPTIGADPLGWLKSKGSDVGFILIGVLGIGLLTYGFVSNGGK